MFVLRTTANAPTYSISKIVCKSYEQALRLKNLFECGGRVSAQIEEENDVEEE